MDAPQACSGQALKGRASLQVRQAGRSTTAPCNAQASRVAEASVRGCGMLHSPGQGPT